MKKDENKGYIYIYKCIVGKNNDFCKIGKSVDYKKRIQQHERTPYYGFIPYTDWDSGEAIYTAFMVKDCIKADKVIKTSKVFNSCSIGGIEIYHMDYNLAIERLYELLINEKLLTGIRRDGISKYEKLNIPPKLIVDEFVDYEGGTTKKDFMPVVESLVKTYKGKYPIELRTMLKTESELKERCPSHYKSGNFVKFNDSENLVIDIHYCKSKKQEILAKLQQFIKE